MIKVLFLAQLLFALSSTNAQCDWTPEVPQVKTTPLHSLAITNTVCHNHIMVLFDKTIGFPFATYAMHSQSQMNQLQGGRKEFVLDPSLPASVQHAANDTVFKYPYSRGHLTPSYIMTYDKSPGGPWEETYFMSNILPQTAALNEGPWEKLEMNIVDNLKKQPTGTVWEIYTGGFWNGKYSITYDQDKQPNTVKDYLFWKAFCDRKKCNSGMITAFFHENVTRWNVHPINALAPGLFPSCCPNNKALDTWSILLEGVAVQPFLNIIN